MTSDHSPTEPTRLADHPSEQTLREPLGATILIVEDQRMIRQAFGQQLDTRGYTSHEAESGERALEQVDAHDVDLVLLDIDLPGIDGFEVLETLREESELSELPVVMLTGNDCERDVLRALELGANDYVTKDTDFQIALARMQTQLRLHDARERLLESARTDVLTGLMNRRAFFERVAEEHERFERSESPYGLMMLDIDHFKKLNDTYGHPEGDRVLRTFARRLERTLRAVDVVARFGGEEFIVLLPESDGEAARTAGERVRQTIAGERFSLETTEVEVTVSVGIAAQSPESPVTPDDLLHRADRAMYRAKRDGRDRVRTDD